MLINGTDYNEDVVATISLDVFVAQHENLPYFQSLPPKQRQKELKDTFLKLGGQIK